MAEQDSKDRSRGKAPTVVTDDAAAPAVGGTLAAAPTDLTAVGTPRASTVQPDVHAPKVERRSAGQPFVAAWEGVLDTQRLVRLGDDGAYVGVTLDEAFSNNSGVAVARFDVQVEVRPRRQSTPLFQSLRRRGQTISQEELAALAAAGVGSPEAAKAATESSDARQAAAKKQTS